VQYIYGPLTNKRDYLDWFFDRVVRGRPLPLPKHGEQFTTLTHVGDVASLLASVVDNPKAKNQIFNAATDRYIPMSIFIER
jgi:nucleoside-diphosphate-sugar epimerase